MGRWVGGIATGFPGGRQAHSGRPRQFLTLKTNMKIIDVPQSGHLGTFISYQTRYGQFRRPYIIPADPKTPVQLVRRARMAHVSARWRTLAHLQHLAWNAAGGQVQSHSCLGKSGPLPGYNLYVAINFNLSVVGEDPVFDPPAFPQFSENVIDDLTITNTDGVTALKLSVPAAPVRYTLVMATKPCSAGVSFPGRFVFIGLLPDPVGGISDITALYVARYGGPPANMRVFIQTVQQINGWKDIPKQTTAVVPPA